MNDVTCNNTRENQWLNPMSPAPGYDIAQQRPVQNPVTQPQEWQNPVTPQQEWQVQGQNPVMPPQERQVQGQNPVTPQQERQVQVQGQGQGSTMPFLGFSGLDGGVVEAPRSPSGILPEKSSVELSGLTALDIFNQPTAVNEQSLKYLNGFLLTQIGKRVTAEFLIGSNTIESRTGTLIGVGANYILLSEFPSNSIISCDFYSIKFIRFYYS